MKLQIPPNVNMKSPGVLLATWFGCGFLQPGHGTWGSAAALPFGLIFCGFLGLKGFLALTIILTLIGWWAASEYEKVSCEHDSKAVVIDEVVGQWLALLPVFMWTSGSFIWVVLSFLLFRFFDILKPWPISVIDEKMKTPFGVMFDDILAGAAAAVIILGVICAGFG